MHVYYNNMYIHILKYKLYVCVCISAVKRLIAINHIHNKSFCLHDVCVLCIFIM